MTTVMNTTAAAGPRTALRGRITATHATILVLMGTGFSINTLLGGIGGLGMYPWLLTNHLAAVGLLQAYLLMAVVGISILIGFATSKPFPRAWHWLAIIAHLPPLLAVAIFAPSTSEMTINFILLSLAIHTTGIAAELFALTRKD